MNVMMRKRDGFIAKKKELWFILYNLNCVLMLWLKFISEIYAGTILCVQ